MQESKRKAIIGVMGPGEGASADEIAAAYELGKLIAEAGWILLSGGRNSGVMDAASKGAKAAGGLTIGILPTTDRKNISDAVDIPILTDMGQARNNINVLTSAVIVACGMGPGTASEVALALKARKAVILPRASANAPDFSHGDEAPPVRILTRTSRDGTISVWKKRSTGLRLVSRGMASAGCDRRCGRHHPHRHSRDGHPRSGPQARRPC